MLVRTKVEVAVTHVNPVIAAGLAATLAREWDFDVRLGTQPEDAAHARPAGSPPGVIVVDYQAGMELADRGRCASSPGAVARKVLVVASSARGWHVRNALQNGIRGYVTTQSSLRELVDAVRSVHRGERYLCPEASQGIAESFSHQLLTAREMDVLRVLGEGLDNKSISRRLQIAHGTVKAHVKSVLAKLEATSRTEAVTTGIRRGYIGDEAEGA